MNTSNFWSVDIRDFIKGAVFAVLSAICAVIGESFTKGVFTLDYTAIWHTAAAAFVAYLIHRFGSGPSVPAAPTAAVQ